MPMVDGKDIIIDQCLFGYNDGHRLISSSLILDEHVHNELLRKSDLYVGVGGSINDFYYTGFPLIKYKAYALIKTWPAPEMNRPGCVWSQVLLIRFYDFENIQDLSSLDSLFVRPNDNFLDYNVKLTLPRRDSFISSFDYEKDKFFKVVRAIHSSYEVNKIIYTPKPSDYIGSIYGIWSLQWPKLRRSLCFSVSSSSAISNEELLKKNDILFVRDEWHTNKVELYDDWLYKLNNLMHKENGRLKYFLWSLGKGINGGRLKFPVMIELFEIINEHCRGSLVSFDSYIKTVCLLGKIIKGAPEVQFGIDLLTELLIHSLKDEQQLAYYCIAILTQFNYDEGIIPADLRERLIKIINTSSANVNFDCLLKEESIRNKGLVATAVIKNSQFDSINLGNYSFRSLGYIYEVNYKAIFSSHFNTLPMHFRIYTIRKCWDRLTDREKIDLVRNLYNESNDEVAILFNSFKGLELLRVIVLGRIYLDNEIPLGIKEKVIEFIIENLNFSQDIAGSYNLLNTILHEYDFNDYIVNLIPASEIGGSMTHHINELSNGDMFNFYSFSYFKSYTSNNDDMAHIVIYSFMQLHELLSRDTFTFKGWEMLSSVLPDVSIFESWDKCYILRKSLIKYCKKNKSALKIVNKYLSENNPLNDFLQRDAKDDLK